MVLHIGKHHYSLMVLYAIVLHLVWAPLLLIDPSVSLVTPLAAIRYILPFPFASITMISAALVSVWAFFVQDQYKAAMMLIPQQFLLVAGAAGAIHGVFAGQFPVNEAGHYSWEFMLASHLPTILAAVGHTLALFSFAWGAAR